MPQKILEKWNIIIFSIRYVYPNSTYNCSLTIKYNFQIYNNHFPFSYKNTTIFEKQKKILGESRACHGLHIFYQGWHPQTLEKFLLILRNEKRNPIKLKNDRHMERDFFGKCGQIKSLFLH